MALFKSYTERLWWFLALMITAVIYSTLFLGRPLAKLFESQDVQAAIFLLGMLLVGVTIILHAARARTGKIEIMVVLGITAVYVMLFLRLGLPERSHLIEYSVLAIFVQNAITERANHVKNISRPALLAFVLTFMIGAVDECIQLLIPHRVFDPNDILFNGIAAAMAIGFSLIMKWVRKRRAKS